MVDSTEVISIDLKRRLTAYEFRGFEVILKTNLWAFNWPFNVLPLQHRGFVYSVSEEVQTNKITQMSGRAVNIYVCMS